MLMVDFHEANSRQMNGMGRRLHLMVCKHWRGLDSWAIGSVAARWKHCMVGSSVRGRLDKAQTSLSDGLVDTLH